jgi:hypothetical protein
MYAQHHIVSRSLKQFFPGNATIPSPFTVVGIDVAVKYINVFNVAMVMYLLHGCRTTIYSVMLLTIIRIERYKCVCILAVVIGHSDRIFFEPYYIVDCGLAVPKFHTLSHKRQN